ncbi:hypothetical protein P280DRAFT_256776 [Massarina eburnea CBS 473.64]|uniref:Mediator of RNA polymerase II transcription subunit 1 n=1 Tax=Massarina eburnea CBS 473.64 TaxID=1395130 RepID=A0A6A6SB06_9PLEO|nr:hypothetical protein P280DRAFT_256776 [Massarina eburnea CBS 473.64]
MATPTPSTNTPQKHLLALSSPAPRSVPPTTFDSPHILSILNEGGIGMGISMSGMGMSQLGFSQMGRGDEDERRRRLENIIGMLKTRPGRVSEEGITALCRKEGLAFEREESSDGNVVLTLIIGNEAMCDIALKKGGDVESVKLELLSDEEGTFHESGSRILFRSLTVDEKGRNKINLMLDQFAGNLDKLLRMDRLSADNGGVQCFKAIFALHGSLKRLFEHEKKIALALFDEDTVDKEHKAEREVMCKKSGRPRINAGACFGLSLEYWMDRRHIFPKSKSSQPPSAKGKEKASASTQTTDSTNPEDAHPDINRIYSLTIECEASPSSLYTPIRIPSTWLSDTIEAPKAPDGADADINNLLNTPTINWLDPKPTYLDSPAGATGDHDAMTIDNAPGRLPNIRFVARFNPPLVFPLNVYANIMNSVGLQCPEDLHATTFAGLGVRPGEPDPATSSMAGGYTTEIFSEREVMSVGKDGEETVKKHKNSLYVPKLEFSRTLDVLPFQHPRQLVELLPTLRQYAHTTSLIQHTFVDKAPEAATEDQKKKNKQTSPPSPPLTPKPPTTPDLQLDVSLSYSPPAPRLTISVPHPNSTTIPLPSPSSSSSSSSSDNQNPSTPSTPALELNPSHLLAQLLDPSASISSTYTSSSALQPHPHHHHHHHHQPLRTVFDILTNGDLFIHEQNVVTPSHAHAHIHAATDKSGATTTTAAAAAGGGEDTVMRDAENAAERVKRVGRALEVCGDLGVWAEWVRREVLMGAGEQGRG